MPPRMTSTPSSRTSFAAFSAATASSVALSSRQSSSWRPRRPPLALMSPITMRATFALATPTNESGPVWSAITPTLMVRGLDMIPPSLTRSRAEQSLNRCAPGVRGCSPSARADTSGVRPIFSPPLRLAELVATLALAQDNAFGQPLESQLRSCLLASWLCEEAEFDDEVRTDAYWVSLLRYVGCTGHAHEVATLFGDEIAIRARTLVHDAGNPAEVMRDVFEYATAWRPEDEREAVVKMLQETAHQWAVHNFASGCEVADMLVMRLDFGPSIREALACTFERWNGKGFPLHVSGDEIPLPMRIVHLSHDMEAIGRLFSPEQAVAAARDRRDETYDPVLADLFLEHGAAWFERLHETEPWDAVLALEPEPRRTLEGETLDRALEVAADFIDLKSSYWGGHSRRCAQLAADAARVLGFSKDDASALRRAALVHDFGTSAVPNSIWDKPGALPRTEFD